MRFLLALLLAATGALASPALIVGQWALDWFSVQCTSDGTYCDYRLQVTEDVFGARPNTTLCAFTVGSYHGIPAQSVNFTDMACDDADFYRINASWDEEGFITLCVSHADEDEWAFFGYQAFQVIDTNATWMNVRPAYKMFTFNRTMTRGARRMVGGGQTTGRSLAMGEPVMGAVSDNSSELYWTIEDFSYSLSQHNASGSWTREISFDIAVTDVSSEGTRSRHYGLCSTLELMDDGQDAALASFHRQPCFQGEDEYTFSWYPWTTYDAAWLIITNHGKALRLTLPVGGVKSSGSGTLLWGGGPFRPKHLGKT